MFCRKLAMAAVVALACAGARADALVFNDPASPTITAEGAASATGITSTIPLATFNATFLSLLSPDGVTPALIDLTQGGQLAINAALSDYAPGGGASDGKGIAIAGSYLPPEDGEINSSTARVYWRNLRLDDILEVMAKVHRNQTDVHCRGITVSRTSELLVMDFIFYCDGGDYLTGTRIEFAQQGNDVTARETRSGFLYCRNKSVTPYLHYPEYLLPCSMDNLNGAGGTHARICVPILKPTVKVAGSVEIGGTMELRNATLALAAEAQSGFRMTGTGGVCYVDAPAEGKSTFEWNLAQANSVYGPVLFDGVRAEINDGRFGEHPLVIVKNGAEVSVSNSMSLASVSRTYYVHEGSQLEFLGRCNNDSVPMVWDHFYIDGGSLKWSAFQGVYMGYLSLANGARVYGERFRMGHLSGSPVIVSDGTAGVTNEVASHIAIYQQGATKTFGFACRTADCLFSGSFQYAENGYRPHNIRKYGACKLILAGAFNETTSHIDVVSGPLRVATSTAISADNAFSLWTDSTLEVAAGVAVAPLSLAATNSTAEATSVSHLVFEEGASLTLPANGLSLVNGATLRIDGMNGQKPLRVGTSKCLTDSQLLAIRCRIAGEWHRVRQDADGYLEPYIRGVTVSFR